MPVTTIVGRLGTKETTIFNENKRVTNFSIAVNNYVNNEETGDLEKKTHWFQIEAWDSKSKVIENHISKGQLIAVRVEILNNLSSSDPKYKGRIKFVTNGISFQPEKKTNFTASDIDF